MQYQEMLDAYEAASTLALPSRKITRETCEAWGYKVRQMPNGEWHHLCPYRDERGRIIDIKVRNVGTDGTKKDFFWMLGSKGREAEPPILGLHRWERSGKMLILTEGEIDLLTVSQAFGNQFSQGSLPNGAGNAAAAVAKHIERISDFERIVIWFDNDEPGQKAAEEVARLLPPGKGCIVHSAHKDASEMLQSGAFYLDLTRLCWNAPTFRPDGITSLSALRAQILSKPEMGLPWAWPTLTEWTYGRRYGELIGIGAGTGQGKSDFLAEEVAHTVFDLKEKVGVFAWESGPAGYAKQVLGKRAGLRFHIPNLYPENPEWTQEHLEEALLEYDNLAKELLFLNDHRGATDWDSVKDRIRFLVHSEGVRHIVLDPLTALSALAADERREMERLMAEASALTAELNICTYFTSHLATPEGKSHEEGGRVEMRHFKGSRAVGFWCNFAFGMERNQQAETEEEGCKTTLRCLKDRYTGNALGKTMALHYNRLNGRLEEAMDKRHASDAPADMTVEDAKILADLNGD
jgi:twinkle protein